MSLITEALRRTRDTSLLNATPPVIAAPPPVRPAVVPPPLPQPALCEPSAGKSGLKIALLVLLVVAFLGAAYAGYKALSAQPSTPPSPPTSQPVARTEPAPPVVETPKPEPPPAPVAAPAPEPVKPPREVPTLTLQGITRDKSGYEALINSWNVRVGDEIEGARVTAIENGVVKLDFDGREIVLRLR
jgi:hypothetical protein